MQIIFIMGFNVLKIKGVLSEKRITQKELADALGKTTHTVINYFNGRSKIDANTLYKISSFLEVPISAFFEDEKGNDLVQTGEKIYIEDRIDNIEQRLKKIEDARENT